MEKVVTKNIRNLCLLGHSGGGKTSLMEAMLYIAKETDRLGKVGEGNTVSDYDAEEIRRGFSLSASLASLTWRDIRFHILDVPGYFDFEGELRQCVRVADAAVIVVDGKAGVEVGTELAWTAATEAGIPKAFFINRFDDGECRFHKAFHALRDHFGVKVCPVQIPLIDGDKVIGFVNLVRQKVYTFDSANGAYVESDIPEQFKDTCDEYHNMLL
ncbi:MAG: elongation factor G, partial [Clostridia bacterium]|nr:elongation factor G [Clostridia bacterium]